MMGDRVGWIKIHPYNMGRTYGSQDWWGDRGGWIKIHPYKMSRADGSAGIKVFRRNVPFMV